MKLGGDENQGNVLLKSDSIYVVVVVMETKAGESVSLSLSLSLSLSNKAYDINKKERIGRREDARYVKPYIRLPLDSMHYR